MEKKPILTPLTQQHQEIKTQYPDAILLFRVGDFYETFGADAIRTAKILGITLTQRGYGSSEDVKLAGFPYHSLDVYLPKLIRAGCRVAICEQLEDPKSAKGIVKRGVTEVITPGVSYHQEVLEQKKNNFLAALYVENEMSIGISFLDASTGEFFVSQGNLQHIQKLYAAFSPKEIVYAKPQWKKIEQLFTQIQAHGMEDWAFDLDFAQNLLTGHFGTYSLQGFGVQHFTVGIVAAGAILQYLKDIRNQNIAHIIKIQAIFAKEVMGLDAFTLRNLEIFESSQIGGTALIDVLDHTVSGMGARKLRQWLALPLLSLPFIEERLNFTDFFCQEENLREELRSLLAQMADVERLIGKIAVKKINPTEILTLMKAFSLMKKIQEEMDMYPILQTLNLRSCQKWIDLIAQTIHPEAPTQISKGKVITKGFSLELDDLRAIAYSGKDYLLQLQQKEAQRTQIPSLKINYNQVFGYYIEIRNLHKDKVPTDWIRKQTLSNAERYITLELKEYEEKILTAEEKIILLETQIFNQFIDKLLLDIPFIQNNAQLIAQLDVLLCFAQVSVLQNYTRPKLQEKDEILLEDLRHPVIETKMKLGEEYVANSVFFNNSQQILLITGPNMGGKSALLRQTALAILMAQIGCFVPAKKAEIGWINQIFTRVGASDNLSMGESTFMVEMNEMAHILNNLSPRSLVLLDEIGRGTSTHDGIAIAWSITAHLHDHPYQPKILFATHYHELNAMQEKFERIQNYHVHVREHQDKLLFLRKLKPGGSIHSFGIDVAKMAGIPKNIILQARNILSQLEKNQENKVDFQTIVTSEKTPVLSDAEAIFFKDLHKKLSGLDINNLTPLLALSILQEMQQKYISENFFFK